MSAMVRCQEVIDLLMDYLEAELPQSRAAALKAHLDGCSPCLAFLNTYRSTIQVSRQLTVEEIPPELTERLLEFLRRERDPDRKGKKAGAVPNDEPDKARGRRAPECT
ncbi:MAG: zf-HC2 domain-containing protein [Candidatus Rokubacteria bacterium]|nr:zf-HC2 domain-containing protein [Candidatus Rokubacteria bacterium]